MQSLQPTASGKKVRRLTYLGPSYLSLSFSFHVFISSFLDTLVLDVPPQSTFQRDSLASSQSYLRHPLNEERMAESSGLSFLSQKGYLEGMM